MSGEHRLLFTIRERYQPRIADGQLHQVLRVAPVVLIEGPRACGKTWTGGFASRSVTSLTWKRLRL